MTTAHPNASIPIVFLPGEVGKVPPASLRRKIERLVRGRLLLPSPEPYRQAQVELKYDAQGEPSQIVAMLHRAHTYTLDIVLVDIDRHLNVRSIQGP